jgi:hypothetical protein
LFYMIIGVFWSEVTARRVDQIVLGDFWSCNCFVFFSIIFD